VRDEQVHRRAERGVGGQPGVAIRPAALGAEHQFRHWARRTPGTAGLRQHPAQLRNTSADSGGAAAQLLDRPGDDRDVSPVRQLAGERPDLIVLTPQAQHQDPSDVRMIQVPGQRPAHDCGPLR
jgi:hypothetical protein